MSDFVFVLPEAMLVLFGLATLLLDYLLPAEQRAWSFVPALLGTFISMAALAELGSQQYAAFEGAIVVGPFFLFFGSICLVATALAILLSARDAEITAKRHGDYYALMLFAAASMMFLECGNDLAVLFVALETMALCLCALAGFPWPTSRVGAAWKYFLISAFNSAILAYGFSILYGLGGSPSAGEAGTNLSVIAEKIAERRELWPSDPLAGLALVMIAVGIFFWIAAAPFHLGALEAREAAAPPIAAYISIAPTAAGFALLLRFFFTVFWPARMDWAALLGAIAALSLVAGTLGALTQSSIERLLAHSSVAQTGWILLGLATAVNPDGSLHMSGLQAAIYALLAFMLFQAGAWAILIWLRQRGIIGDEMSSLDGLAARHPSAAALLTVFVLSLAGIPPTGGFFVQLLILRALVDTRHIILAAIAVSSMAPAAYYYLRMTAAIWMREVPEAIPPAIHRERRFPAQSFAAAAMMLIVLAAGIFPEPLLRAAANSILRPFVH